MEANLDAVAAVHSFLLREATAGRVSIGLKRLGNQSAVIARLERVGLRKWFFSNGRQFLRDTIAKNLSAYLSVIDMVCVHGVHEGRQKLWTGLGGETDARFETRAEVKFKIVTEMDAFIALLRDARA